MKLNYKRTFFIGLAFLSICSFWQMYDNIIPKILKDTFELKETAVGVIMSMDNVLAVFLLPILGTLSDKVDTRLGKRTPFIIGGTAAAVILMMILPFADATKNLVLFVAVLGLTLLAMATYRSPAVALMPDLTPKPLRSSANAVINLMGAIGGLYALALIFVLVPEENPNYLWLFLGIAAMMVISVVALVITTKEKKIAEQVALEYPEEAPVADNVQVQKMAKPVMVSLGLILASIFLWFTAYNAVTTAFSRYADVVWGIGGGKFALPMFVATGAAIVSYIPIGAISSRIGRKKTILIGLLFMLISYSSVFFYPSFHWSAYAFFALIGMGWAAVSVNSLPMVVEMSKGSDVGKYTGLYYTFSMSAQIFTPIVSGMLLEHVSYATLFPYAMAFTVLSMITMSFVKHGDSKPPKKAKAIENFDVED